MRSAQGIRPDEGTLQHEALFYRDADEFLAGTTPFVRAGLAAGEPVLAAVAGRNVDLLRAALGNPPDDLVRFLDMTDAGRNPGKIIPWILHAFVDEHPRRSVRLIGEPVWAGRSPLEYPACVQHEALINLVFAGRQAAILCPYDASALGPQMLVDAEHTHPFVIRGRGRTHSPHYGEPASVVRRFNRPLPEPPATASALSFDAGDLSEVRRFVAGHAGRAGLDAARAFDVQIAVNEVAGNTVEHSRGPGLLRMWAEDDSVICDVRDSGRMDDPLVGRVPVPPEDERGRGLLLVNHLCDLVRIYTDEVRTTVRMHFRR